MDVVTDTVAASQASRFTSARLHGSDQLVVRIPRRCAVGRARDTHSMVRSAEHGTRGESDTPRTRGRPDTRTTEDCGRKYAINIKCRRVARDDPPAPLFTRDPDPASRADPRGGQTTASPSFQATEALRHDWALARVLPDAALRHISGISSENEVAWTRCVLNWNVPVPFAVADA